LTVISPIIIARGAPRFMGLVAEDVAEVGDRGVEYGERRRGDGPEREPDYGGRRFVATEPIE
jgi:hypothetical protein